MDFLVLLFLFISYLKEVYNISMPSPSPFFCRYPFTFVSKAAGEYCKPCCMYRLNEEEKKDSALKGSVEEAFTSQTFQKIREKMQNKEWIAGCHKCYREEEAGYKSYGRFLLSAQNILPLMF